MKKTKKILALALAAVMLVCTTVAATVAYLQDTSEVVTNTMTVGKVEITLDEAPVDVYGEVVEGDRVTENTYKLIPGHEYAKDPTVHIDDESEESWLFVRVVNGISDIEDQTNTIAAQMATNGWSLVDGETEVYAWQYTVTAGADVNVFSTFTVDGGANVANYVGATVVITAYAVQADGFASAQAAWDATFGA